MKLTLWFLNRITEWEVEKATAGQLATALSGKRHDVRLGRRVLERTPAETDTVDLIVNNTEPSFRGELMHEGHLQAVDGRGRSDYDEYFMPIPLKCLGKPDYDANGNPQLTPFWKGLISDANKQAEFLRILTPEQSENHCFSADLVDRYWQEKAKQAIKGDSELAKAFSDVRMNTSVQDKIGYYQILQQAMHNHGPNVLIGYSQGGAVVNYLAYIDEHFVDRNKRCIAGVISVQGALRGSTLAMSSRAQDVLDSLGEMVRSIWGGSLFKFFLVPSDIQERVDLLLAPEHKLKIDEVVDLLDTLYKLAKPDKGFSRFIRTARKWISGLHHDEQLAFWDLDPIRLNRPGSVMEALDNHPLIDTYCGAVAGANFHLEPLLHAVIQYQHPTLAKLGFLLRGLLRLLLHGAEVIYRTKTFDMMPRPLTPPNDRVAILHSDWHSEMPAEKWSIRKGGAVPAMANDCVIPTACQMLRPIPESPAKFLGNYVNQDASHASGAFLDDTGPTDIDYVKELLRSISDKIS